LSCKKDEKYNTVKELYEGGLSVREIAKMFNVTHQSMWKIIKRRLSELRPQKQEGCENEFYRGGILHNKYAHHQIELA